MTTQSQSSLSAARRCLRLYELRYNQRLDFVDNEGREALEVGTLWHKMLAASAEGADPFAVAAEANISLTWKVKLSRLFAAREYHWHSENAKYEIVRAEDTFKVHHKGRVYVGQIDARLRTREDGRSGIMESKTTSESLDADSTYWRKLRLDVQVGLYGLAGGKPVDFILYDVVRKPTINPARIKNDEVERMKAEFASTGKVTYFTEEFTEEAIGDALEEGRENPHLYGARLTADILLRPEFYFSRREVARTHLDYTCLLEDLESQSRLIEVAEAEGLWPRNPDACHSRDRGACEFFNLCARDTFPRRDAPPPGGYLKRELRHPELGDAIQPKPEGD